jgi:hypothetical protein
MADGTTETVTQTAPTAFAQPFLQFGMQEAGRLYGGYKDPSDPSEDAKTIYGPQFFQGQTYAGFDPYQTEAMTAQVARARAGSPLTQQAQATLGSFLGSTGPEGQYVPPAQSGLLTGAIQRALAPVQARVQSQLAQRGRLGSGAAADVTARALGDVAADIAYRDFATQRGLGLQAAQMAPAMAAADYADIARLQQAGAQRQAMAQKQVEENMRRYQYEQMAPYENLVRYQNLIAGFPMGDVSTQITPYFEPSSGQQFLGGAASLLGALGAENLSPSERFTYGILGGALGSS